MLSSKKNLWSRHLNNVNYQERNLERQQGSDEHFALSLQLFTPVPSSSTDISEINTQAKAEIPKNPPQKTTSVKIQSLVKSQFHTSQKMLLPDQEELLKFQLNSKNNGEAEVNLCAEAEVNN